MPKSACTNGSATGIDHMPTLPMVLTATANPSRRHAAGVSTSLSWRSSKSMELPGDEFMTPTSSTWNGETDVHLYTMSALAPKADIGTQPCNVCFVPKADILRCGRERRYSIISSAVASSVCGNVRPNVLAVLRFRTRSNFVGCSTGKSDGFEPCSSLCPFSELFTGHPRDKLGA